MVTPGQALKFTFPTPKIHFSYNKHCFRKFDSSVAVSQEEHGSRVFAQTLLSLGCCCVHLAGQDWRRKSRHGCGAVASEAKPAGPAPWEGHPHWHPRGSCFKKILAGDWRAEEGEVRGRRRSLEEPALKSAEELGLAMKSVENLKPAATSSTEGGV